MSKFLRIFICRCCIALAFVIVCLGLVYIASKFSYWPKSSLDKLEFLAIVGPTIIAFTCDL